MPPGVKQSPEYLWLFLKGKETLKGGLKLGQSVLIGKNSFLKRAMRKRNMFRDLSML